MKRMELERVAGLIAERNAVDAEIGAITGRPVVAGHLGEWIAAQVFDIALESSAVAEGIDGRFASGAARGTHGQREVVRQARREPRPRRGVRGPTSIS